MPVKIQAGAAFDQIEPGALLSCPGVYLRGIVVLKQWQFMVLTALALVSGVLMVTTIVLISGTRAAQNEFSTRAQYIQQSQQLEPLYQSIVRSLAEISAKTNDAQITRLLAAQGITFTVNPTPGQAQAAEGTKEAKGKTR